MARAIKPNNVHSRKDRGSKLIFSNGVYWILTLNVAFFRKYG
jgi:hypothetical protein